MNKLQVRPARSRCRACARGGTAWKISNLSLENEPRRRKRAPWPATTSTPRTARISLRCGRPFPRSSSWAARAAVRAPCSSPSSVATFSRAVREYARVAPSSFSCTAKTIPTPATPRASCIAPVRCSTTSRLCARRLRRRRTAPSGSEARLSLPNPSCLACVPPTCPTSPSSTCPA